MILSSISVRSTITDSSVSYYGPVIVQYITVVLKHELSLVLIIRHWRSLWQSAFATKFLIDNLLLLLLLSSSSLSSSSSLTRTLQILGTHNVQNCSVASQSVTWSPMDQHFLIPRAMFTKRSKRWSLFTCENRTRCSLRIVCLTVLPYAAHINSYKLIATNKEFVKNNGFSCTRGARGGVVVKTHATNRQVADSIPDGVIGNFQWHNLPVALWPWGRLSL